jgi:predicted PurR-regulated permease PerM
MHNQKIHDIFFFTLLILSFILFLLLIKPYIGIIIAAGALAIVFKPIYNKILKKLKNKKSLASFISILLVIIIILAPLTLIGFQVYKEASSLYSGLSNNDFSQIDKIISWSEKSAQKISPSFSLNLNAQQIVSPILSFTVKHLGDIFSGAAKIFLNLSLGLIALFYFFKEGGEIKKYIANLIPLSNKNGEEIFISLKKTINASIKGNVLVAFLQGITVALGFWMFGLPNGALWGSVAMIASFIPGIGMAIIIIPSAIVLLAKGNFLMTLGFLIWTLGINAILDYLVGPKLKKGAGLHPLLILFSVLGGIAMFGPMGILIGPMIVSLFVVLLKIFDSFS